MPTANLPTAEQVAHARLPRIYEVAKHVLARCTRVDECKDWADKALALASYAKQADDDTLLNHARRIQARAVRRCGELLQEFQTKPQGGRPRKNGGGAPTVSQRGVAGATGLSKDQEVTARRVANVPQEDFDAAVESDSPPTVTELANQGRTPREVVGDLPPESYSAATGLIGNVGRLAEFCESHDPSHVFKGIKPHELERVSAHMRLIQKWWAEFSSQDKGAAA